MLFIGFQFLIFSLQNIEAYMNSDVIEITLLILKLQQLMCVKLVFLLSKKASSNLQLKTRSTEAQKMASLSNSTRWQNRKERPNQSTTTMIWSTDLNDKRHVLSVSDTLVREFDI